MFLWRMGVLFEINRDFPFQISLPFDEAGMEVLEWLDEDTRLEWTCTSTCRRTPSAIAFVPRPMRRRSSSGLQVVLRKGELSAASIDRGWPYQVVLSARFCERGGYKEIHKFCADLTLCSRGHSLYHDGQWFHVYCFKEPTDAQKFLERFGGEKFDPAERGRGANWARWRKR